MMLGQGTMSFEFLSEVWVALLIDILHYFKMYSIISQINQTNTSTRKQAYLQGEMIESWQPREATF